MSGIGESSDAVARIAEALARLGERKYTWPELCERARVEHSIADPLWRALGFPDVPPDESAYTDDDVRALRIAAEGVPRLQGEERQRALEFIVRDARTVSGHLARIAEQQVDAWPQLRAMDLRESTLAQAMEVGFERSALGWLIMYGLPRRLDEAMKRRAELEVGTEPELVVGFVDLVGFTRASTGLDAAAFGRLLGRFEALAWDEVTEAGGRLVKLVGDEAMFVCPPGVGAAEATLAILLECGRGELPPARSGLAAGQVLIRGSDYFGPVVNRASRLVDMAAKNSVVVDGRYREMLERHDTNFSLVALEPRELKDIGSTDVWELSSSVGLEE